MQENRKQFYLYDRWYYLIKETEDKLTYVSNPDDYANTNIVEMEKDTNEVSVIAKKDDEFLAKLYISDITQREVYYHYKENTPQDVYIDDELYVNLILEAFVETNYGRINKESLIRISRKKNMDKIVYDTPNIPLDENIDMEKFKIKSKMLDYFLGVVENFSTYAKKISKYTTKTKPEEETEEEKNKINLNIPGEIYFYDRKYTLKGGSNRTIIFENNQDSEDILTVNIDPDYHNITGINLETLTKRNIKFSFKANMEGQNKIRVNFSNDRKAKIKITQASVIETLFEYDALYNRDGKSEFVTLKFEKNNTLIRLTPHPIFSNQYVDNDGNEYCFGNQDYSRLSGISAFIPNIFNGLEYQLTKK